MQSVDLSQLVSFTIAVNAQPLPEAIRCLTIELQLQADGRASASMVLDSALVPSTQKLLLPGSAIELGLGPGGLNQLRLSGQILSLRLRLQPNLPPTLELQCQIAQVLYPSASEQSELVLIMGESLLAADLTLQLRPGEPAQSEFSVSGQVQCSGSIAAQPGGLLVLRGCGRRFDGAHRIGQVTHHISEGRWLTEVSLT
ncbi:hypothetical protein H8K47_14450 [Undibacterium sp. CY7W]|uniref:Uncharacterized protein n=1 Tax=Undibacterium rugosum TaxID=2762291 RepID=A0A923I5L5_9BURK|nr:hypothetical protein [Undibacterium rugosum]MBC3936564.1 hypothetical protein [Undibacterium rugosum]